MEAVEQENENLLNKFVSEDSAVKLLSTPFPDSKEEIPWGWRRGLSPLTVIMTRIDLFPNKNNLKSVCVTLRDKKRLFYDTRKAITHGPFKQYTDGQVLVHSV